LNLPFFIARRYLLAKKSSNAINIITGISVAGIAIGTAALVLVLSVFNGLGDLVMTLTSNFNPDIKITPTKGKTFQPDSLKIYQLTQLPGVEFLSRSVEEVAFFEYQGTQDFGILKGIDSIYAKVSHIDTAIEEGNFRLKQGDRYLAVLGKGMRNKLTVQLENVLEPIAIYMPRTDEATAMETQFRKRFIYPVGTFATQQDNDNQYVLASLRFVQELLGNDRNLSALELKLLPDADILQLKSSIAQILGTDVTIKDKLEQEEAFLKIMNLEKWMAFAILTLTLMLVIFNMVGALWMIVLDKKKDISILKSMGMTKENVRNIYLFEGFLLSIIGASIGFVIAIVLYLIQKNFGIISMPTGFVVDSYPISLKLTDFIFIAFTVLSLGFLASILPSKRAMEA
jgi:lipoprotein-releasing system permease protein